MDLNEVTDLIRMNMMLYKNSAKPLSEKELEAMASVWFWHFKDYDAKVVKRAFLAANAVCVYPIQPADIFKQLNEMQKRNQPSDVQLWDTLKESLSKIPALMHRKQYPLVLGIDEKTGKLIQSDGRKEIKEIYDNLPEQIKKFFASVNGMVDFSLLSEDEIERYRKREFFEFLEKQENYSNANNTQNRLSESKRLRLEE